ncbi:MAG: carbon starvation protein A [Phycisphaerales bacterium]
MSLLVLTIIVSMVLIAGYFTYGRFIARQYALDDANVTPATRVNDGVDFVPTPRFYLLGQHLSAIAAAGPIAGPILACSLFGWGPCLLWIVLGVIFIGAVHDLSALVASVRHGAGSIAEVARVHLGRRAFVALAAFIWLALLYVITAFTQITASTFVGASEELAGLNTTFSKGGAVAMSSVLYLLLALVMGIVTRLLRPPVWVLALVFVPLTLGCVYAGSKLDGVLLLDVRVWYALILGYCFVASLIPVWLLQQPRGFLGGFVLYLAIGVGLAGILAGGFDIQQPMFTQAALDSLNPLAALQLAQAGTSVSNTPMLIPFLFVTIACGACSGFHGLICGGTTSKQVAKESHCHSIGYGAMLLEGLVAVIALATIMILTPAQSAGQAPARVYGDGLAQFLTVFLGPGAFLFCATFGAMAFSTFVFDTLDVSTRLGRYLLSELFGARGRAAGVAASAATVGVPLAMLLGTDPEGYRLFWMLFGTSNQLLASLTLLGVTIWLRSTGRACWYVFWPCVVVGSITLWALALQFFVGARDVWLGAFTTPGGAVNPAIINALVAAALMGLAGVFVVEAFKRRHAGRAGAANAASSGA